MKKKLLAGLAVGVMMAGMAGVASALTIDTSSSWNGRINSGWAGSGQSLTVDAVENHFESIGFYFAAESIGKTFDFILSDAMNGGSTLFTTSFNVINGINVIDIDQDVTANSTIYALIDYNGFMGATAHFIGTDVYAGGQSVFGPVGNMDGSYTSLDHRFVATFSSGGAPVPEPATMLLFGTGLAGLVGARLRRKK
jgi:hypothetical protein